MVLLTLTFIQLWMVNVICLWTVLSMMVLITLTLIQLSMFNVIQLWMVNQCHPIVDDINNRNIHPIADGQCHPSMDGLNDC
jgi:hypothetical protein